MHRKLSIAVAGCLVAAALLLFPSPGRAQFCAIITMCENPVFFAVTFVKQKANGVCVYQCDFTQTCATQEADCSVEFFNQNISNTVKVGPVGAGQCPAADPSLCGA